MSHSHDIFSAQVGLNSLKLNKKNAGWSKFTEVKNPSPKHLHLERSTSLIQEMDPRKERLTAPSWATVQTNTCAVLIHPNSEERLATNCNSGAILVCVCVCVCCRTALVLWDFRVRMGAALTNRLEADWRSQCQTKTVLQI